MTFILLLFYSDLLTNITDFQMTFMCEYNDRNNEVPPPTTTEHQSLVGKGDSDSDKNSVNVKTAFVETRNEIQTEHSTNRGHDVTTTTLFDILESSEDYVDVGDDSEDSDEHTDSKMDNSADVSIGEG